MERRNIKQQYAIKFCVKLGKSAKETLDKVVKVFVDEAMSRAQVFRWHKRIKKMSKSKVKTIMICFFDSKGVHATWADRKSTVLP